MNVLAYRNTRGTAAKKPTDKNASGQLVFSDASTP